MLSLSHTHTLSPPSHTRTAAKERTGRSGKKLENSVLVQMIVILQHALDLDWSMCAS